MIPLPRGLAASAFFSALSVTTFAGSTPNGVPNFHVVNDQVLRGGQPSETGFRTLAGMGVKTIVDLTEDDSRARAEKKFVKAQGMDYVSIPMKGMATPTERQVSAALKILTDKGAAPVFVHCKRGADRTGLIIACYRIEHDGWDNRRALSEARENGMSWFQFPLQRYVSSYEPREPSILNPAAVADAIRDESVDLARKAARGIVGAVESVK